MAYSDLVQDGNVPGYWVCEADRDVYDPWRLPFVPADNSISLRHPRPDTPLYGPNNATNNTISTQGAPNGSPNGLPGGASGNQVPLAYAQQDTLMIEDPEADKFSDGPGLLSL